MLLIEGYVVPHGSKGLELEPVEEGRENTRRFRRKLKETWRAYKGLRARAEERLDIIKEGIRQSRARVSERKEMIAQIRNLEREQGLDRGSADVEGVDNRLETEMKAWSRQIHEDEYQGGRFVRTRAQRGIGRMARSHLGIVLHR